ncbi:MAG: Ig-like domain-containing protein [Gemmatimonadota bacterium]|nr:Ig-like domain-containing protein [Gemmatimonadota bacterium]
MTATLSSGASNAVTTCRVQTPVTSPAAATIQVGDTLRLTATVDASCEPNAVLRWASKTPAVATIDSLSGLVLGVSAGTTLVAVTDRNNSTAYAASTITVAQ